jgi:hypothetical protein
VWGPVATTHIWSTTCSPRLARLLVGDDRAASLAIRCAGVDDDPLRREEEEDDDDEVPDAEAEAAMMTERTGRAVMGFMAVAGWILPFLVTAVFVTGKIEREREWALLVPSTTYTRNRDLSRARRLVVVV